MIAEKQTSTPDLNNPDGVAVDFLQETSRITGPGADILVLAGTQKVDRESIAHMQVGGSLGLFCPLFFVVAFFFLFAGETGRDRLVFARGSRDEMHRAPGTGGPCVYAVPLSL